MNKHVNIPQVKSDVFGTTEKLNIPVTEFVKNLYKPKFKDGINLIQLEVILPSRTEETI